MIETSGLQKHFGAKQAVSNFSFTARDGEITGLLGANGAGKTTTLRMLAGLLKPDRGVIRIDGEELQSGRARPVSLGALLDHSGLYGRLTAQENVAYYAELHGLSSSQAKKRALEVLTHLGMQPVATSRVAGFSLGQRSKVALGRAIIHSPQNLLLDEPTNGLDVPAVRTLRGLLRDIRDAGRCIVFSSHVLDEVEELCDRLVVLSNGAATACGSADEIRRHTDTASLEDAFVKLTEERINARA